MGMREELRRLVEVRPSPRRWPIALNAAVALVVPALVLTLAGQPQLGLIASNGAFLTLYLGDRPLGHRARRLPLIGVALFAAAAIAAFTASVPDVATLVVGAIALVAGVGTLGLRVGPPGGVFFAMVPGLTAATVASSSAGGGGLSAGTVLATLALGLGFGYLVVVAPLALPSIRARARTAGPPAPLRFELGPQTRVVLARVGVAVLLALAVSVPLGLHRGYWVIVTVVAVLQSGGHRRLTTARAANRLLGTALGAVLFVGVSLVLPGGVVLVLALGALQFLVELLIVRHYGLALTFITPLALLVAVRQPGATAPGIALERILDTALGAAIAIVVLLAEFALERVAARTGARPGAPLR